MSVAIPIKHCRLKFLSQLNMGQSPPSEDVTRFDEGDGLPFLQGNAEFGSVSPSYKHTCNNPPKTAVMGNLLVSVRAPVGALNVADQTYGIGRGLCALKWTRIDLRFGWWALHHHRVKLNEVATGSTYEAVSAEDLGNLVLSFPDEQSQRLIANYLDRETARIDGLIAEKERMLALLEEKRAALISRAVTRGLDPNAPLKPSGQEWLGEIPMHWRLERLKFHLLGLEQGWSPQCDNYPAELDDWGVLKVGAVNTWTFNPSENKRLPDELEPLREYEIKPHDVLMSRANTTQLLGSVVYVHEISSKLLLCDKLYRLNVNDDEVDREFLVAFLRASPGRFQLEREASGTSGSMQNIGQDAVQNAWIAIPPFDEQKRISRHVAESRKDTEKIEAALRRTVDLLRERRAALITAAVTGQIPLEAMRG
ncbi:MAG: restriction endonuclease subunit S [Candidatus Competibacter denitrificans]